MSGRRRVSVIILLALIIGTVAGVVVQNETAMAKKPKASKVVMQVDPSAIASNKQVEVSAPLGKTTTTVEKRPTLVDSSVIHYRNKVLVLTYHDFNEKESTYTMTPERFRAHLEVLKNNHYNVITMEDFIDFLNGVKDVPPNAVVITIDDGYLSVYRYAYPELLKYGYPATTFLIVGSVGDSNHKPPFMNWDQIKEMKQNGFSFYSHTYDLHDEKPDDKGKLLGVLANPIFLPDQKRMETEEEYETRVSTDLTKAEKVLTEQLGNTISMLCFPHGAYNRGLIELSQQVGIQYFFTGNEGLNTRRTRELYRIDAGSPWMDPKNFEKKLLKLH